MPVQRTISPANYLTPTDKEIAESIQRTFGNDNVNSYSSPNKGVDLNNVPHDLIRDIANMAAGGIVVDPSTLIENVYEDVKKRKTGASPAQLEHADRQRELRLCQQERRINAEDNG